MERNRVEFTGTVERLRSIPTKSGTPMAKFLLKVGDYRFPCVSFSNLAGIVFDAGEGVEIGLVGQAAINSWKTDDGTWRNDFQCTAWSVEVDGIATAFEKNGATRRPLKNEEFGRQQPPPTGTPRPGPRDTDEFAHKGGPF